MQLHNFTPRPSELLALLVGDDGLDRDVEVGDGRGVVTQPDPVGGVRQAGEIDGMSEILSRYLRNVKYLRKYLL